MNIRNQITTPTLVLELKQRQTKPTESQVKLKD